MDKKFSVFMLVPTLSLFAHVYTLHYVFLSASDQLFSSSSIILFFLSWVLSSSILNLQMLVKQANYI